MFNSKMASTITIRLQQIHFFVSLTLFVCLIPSFCYGNELINSSAIAEQNNHTVNGTEGSKSSIYLMNDGKVMKLDVFMKIVKENMKKNDDFSMVLSSCRNFAMQVEKENIEGLDIEQSASKLVSHLRTISNHELGVTQMQTVYDRLPFKNKRPNYSEKTEMIAGRIKKKLGNYIEALDKTKRYVEELYIQHLWMKPIVDVFSCHNVNNILLKYDPYFGTEVNSSFSCELISKNETEFNFGFSPGRNLTHLLNENREAFPQLKWQYFITSNGINSEYPAYNPDSDNPHENFDTELRHNSLFVSTIHPSSKLLIILVDISNSMTDLQINLAKRFAIGIINSLSESDFVGLVSIDHLAHHPCLDYNSEPIQSTLRLTKQVKIQLISCIENLKKETYSYGANYSAGLNESFNVISKSMEEHQLDINSPNVQPILLFVSRGLIWNLHQLKSIFKLIEEENEKLNRTVVINTCAVVNGVQAVENEKHFLKMVAEQRDFKNMNVSVKNVKVGQVIEFNSQSSLRAPIDLFWSSFRHISESNIFFSLPWWDTVSLAEVVSLSRPCFHMRNVVGMVGIDVDLNDLAEDINYYSHSPSTKSYAFIVHESGFLVAHSLVDNPLRSKASALSSIDVSFTENNVLNFTDIRSNLLTDYVGQKRLKLKTTMHGNVSINSHATYTWRKIDGTPYTVCIVTYNYSKSKPKHRTLNLKKPSCSEYVRYHRLDINPPQKSYKNLCKRDGIVISYDTSTLFLSPSSFNYPYKYLKQMDKKGKMDSYLGYICDTTNLIPNPGVREIIRNDVAAVTQISKYWQRQKTSRMNDYIVRRFVGLPSGVLHTYPGMVVNKNYDVTRQYWYKSALEHVGKIVVNPPFQGNNPMEIMITISHTIYEGKHASMHSKSDSVIAVMGMDVTYGYLYQLLTSSVPLCLEATIRCFLFDHRGYLIVHPDMGVSDASFNHHFNHITHGEQLIANDILCHEGFVEKHACEDYQTQTLQRSYRFNTEWRGVLTNLVHGEQCARYRIKVVPGTNLFLGVINQTCNVRSAFCACSTIDNLCLNCHKMEQSECECPCECPLKAKFSSHRLCKAQSHDPLPAPINTSLLDRLDRCLTPNCKTRKNLRGCLGVIGCIWCERNYDGLALSRPVCVDQLRCFQGILAKKAGLKGSSLNTDTLLYPSLPLTIVSTAVLILFIIFFYFARKYRQVANHEASAYDIPTNGQAFQVIGAENEDCTEDVVQAPNPHSLLLAEFQNVSPYRMQSNYRRPNGAESSDHGYSTMSPLDDSVCNGLSSSERAASINRDSVASQFITDYESEASTDPQMKLITQTTQTVLPEETMFKHGTKFEAQVQVHMAQC